MTHPTEDATGHDPAPPKEPVIKAQWSLLEECGGEARLRALLQDFYDTLYNDVFIGFFFLPHDKQSLIEHQLHYVIHHLGKRPGADTFPPYEGRSMREAHQKIPILAGHFDRRHVLLKETLERHDVPEHVREAWLELDQRLRPLILKKGRAAADELNQR